MKDVLRFAGYFLGALGGAMITNEAMAGMFRILTEHKTAREADQIWRETIKTAGKADGPGTGG